MSRGGIFKRDLLPPAVAVGLRHRSLREVLDPAVVDGPGRAAADLERRPVPGACAIAREVSPHAGMRDNKKGGGTYRCMLVMRCLPSMHVLLSSPSSISWHAVRRSSVAQCGVVRSCHRNGFSAEWRVRVGMSRSKQAGETREKLARTNKKMKLGSCS